VKRFRIPWFRKRQRKALGFRRDRKNEEDYDEEKCARLVSMPLGCFPPFNDTPALVGVAGPRDIRFRDYMRYLVVAEP